MLKMCHAKSFVSNRISEPIDTDVFFDPNRGTLTRLNNINCAFSASGVYAALFISRYFVVLLQNIFFFLYADLLRICAIGLV